MKMKEFKKRERQFKKENKDLFRLLQKPGVQITSIKLSCAEKDPFNIIVKSNQ